MILGGCQTTDEKLGPVDITEIPARPADVFAHVSFQIAKRQVTRYQYTDGKSYAVEPITQHSLRSYVVERCNLHSTAPGLYYSFNAYQTFEDFHGISGLCLQGDKASLKSLMGFLLAESDPITLFLLRGEFLDTVAEQPLSQGIIVTDLDTVWLTRSAYGHDAISLTQYIAAQTHLAAAAIAAKAERTSEQESE